MPLRDILVDLTVHPDPIDPALARYVADLAATAGAGLTAFLARPDIRPPTHGLATGVLDSVASDLEERAEAAARSLEAAFLEAAKAKGVAAVPAYVTCSPGVMGKSLAMTARTHDLTVCALAPDDAARRGVVEEAVFGSGRPVLAVRDPAPSFRLERVALAWDMSRPAARAASDALPLLQMAQETLILTVTDERDLPTGDLVRPIADHLALHGVKVRPVAVEAKGRGIGAALMETAVAEGADLLAMGAFGHSRVREFLLGGATAAVMADLRLPVLFAH